MSRIPHNKKFNAEVAEKIVEMYSEGKTLTQITVEIGINPTLIFDWRLQYPDFDARLSGALEAGLELHADKLLTVHEQEDVNRARLQSDNLKWILTKKIPTKYGDKLTLDVNQTIDIKSALLEAKQRIGIQSSNAELQAIDVTPKNQNTDTDAKSVDAKTKDAEQIELDELLK